MKSILVPTDFSTNAFHAARYAMALARELNAAVTLLNVYHIPDVLQPLPLEIVITPDELKRDTEAALAREREKLLEDTHMEVQVDYRCAEGHSVQEISRQADALHADLIVMGMRGKGKVRKALFGSVATGVIRHTVHPVLVVPEDCAFRRPANLMIAVDTGDTAPGTMLGPVIDIAHHFKSTLHFMNVNHPRDEFDSDSLASQFEGKLNTVKYDFTFVESDLLYDAFAHFITTNHIDLLVMFPHHRGMLNKIFSGDHTEHMAFQTHVPLLALPERA